MTERLGLTLGDAFHEVVRYANEARSELAAHRASCTVRTEWILDDDMLDQKSPFTWRIRESKCKWHYCGMNGGYDVLEITGDSRDVFAFLYDSYFAEEIEAYMRSAT